MIDPDLKAQLDSINQHLVEIKNKKVYGGVARSFFSGMFNAFGYLVGIIVVIVIVGWFLNKTGLLGPFQEQWQKFQNFMNQAESTMNSSQAGQGNVKSGDVITLPDGRQVKVVPQ